jgi:hypothetical protein
VRGLWRWLFEALESRTRRKSSHRQPRRTVRRRKKALIGSVVAAGELYATPSRAGLIMPIISAPGSMPGSSTNGSLQLDYAAGTTTPIHSAERSVYHVQQTGNLRAVQILLGLRRSRARSATSASISRMPSRWLKARECSLRRTPLPHRRGVLLLLHRTSAKRRLQSPLSEVTRGSPNLRLKDAYCQ